MLRETAPSGDVPIDLDSRSSHMQRISRPSLFLSCLVLVAAAALPALNAASGSTQSPTTKVVYAGRLIDGTSNMVRTNVSIVVDGDRIREMRDGRVTMAGAELIDRLSTVLSPS